MCPSELASSCEELPGAHVGLLQLQLSDGLQGQEARVACEDGAAGASVDGAVTE